MKCEFCGGTLTLEEENCPHCGQANPHARQHVRDMQRYHGEFESTKSYVYNRTERYTQLAVRAAVLAVLAAVIFLTGLLAANIDSIVWELSERKANRHYEEYSRILDQYLEEEDYLAVNAFAYTHDIDSFRSPYTGKYGVIIPASQAYRGVYEAIMRIVTSPEDSEDTIAQQALLLSGELEFFYNYTDRDYYTYTHLTDESVTGKAIEGMTQNVEGLLVTYCGLEPEEAAQVKELSRARCAVLLEERIGEVTEDEQKQ